ncbi:MAG: Gfo/Idh/MocA family protein [Armatimonadota bacterium]
MQRVGVVGAGTMGRVHAEAYSSMPNAELVAVCDTRLEAARQLAEKYSIKAFDNVRSMLAEVECDLVDICTPTQTHIDYIKIVAEAGKHICCEKPLTRTTGQALEAIRVCEEAGVVLFPAQVLRWFPEFRKMHDLIASGVIGTPVVARTSRCSAYPRGADDWFADMRNSGGVALDMIIHDYDWLRWCFGKVKRVYARGLYEANIPLTDYALVTLRFESGVIAHVEGNWARPSGFVATVEVAGTDGLLSYSNVGSVPLTIELKAKGEQKTGVTVPESPTSKSPYYLELEHLVNCLESGCKPEVTAEDGLEAVRIGEAALKSISTGQPVALA